MNAKKRPQAVTEQEWVGQCLRYWRTKVGFRQADLADLMREELGTPWKQGVVANIEAGSRAVSLVELMALCVVLGVSLYEFLYPRDDNNTAHDIEYVEMPDQVAFMNVHALGRTLAGGLDAATAETWSLSNMHRDQIDPAAVTAHTYELRGDPDLALLRDEVPVDDDRLRELIDAVYREQFPQGRYVSPFEGEWKWKQPPATKTRKQRTKYTATQLVDALTEQFIDEQVKKLMDAGERMTGDSTSERARNATRAHARTKAAKLIMRKALEK